MKATLTKEEMSYYVSDADMIGFIEENSDMEWNTVCDFVREQGITSDGYGPAYWEKEEMKSATIDEYNAEQIKWINAFFDAHPWIDRMMVVFDD